MSTSVSANGSWHLVRRQLLRQAKRGNLRFKARQMLDEQLDNVWIEMIAGAAQQKSDGFVARHAATERTVLSDRIETVDDRNDSRRDRNLFAFQSVGIAKSVPLLVMMTHDRRDRIREINATENLRAHSRVDLHLFKLSGGQPAGLVDDVRGHREFPDVVKQRSGFKRGDFRLAKVPKPCPSPAA